jgi:quercetin dioxygenase-like cupin family protein
VNFPINKTAGSADSAVVYFEIEPGDRLATHTDSEEEVLYIVSGTGEAEVGDERGVVSTGDLAVVPALVPHGLRNIGDERLRVVGFFSGAEIESVFDEPVQPVGATTMIQAPIPAAAIA